MHRSVPRFGNKKGEYEVVEHTDNGKHVVLFSDPNKKVCIHWLQKLEREESVKRKKNHVAAKPSGWRKIVVDGIEYWWKGSAWPIVKRVSDRKVWNLWHDYYNIVHPPGTICRSYDNCTWTPKDVAEAIKFIEEKEKVGV